MEIFVSNIAFDATEAQLSALFEEYGNVESCRIIHDRESGRSKGYGFVRMPDNESGTRAIQALNEQHLGGRALVVRVSVPKEKRQDGPGGGYQRRHGSGKGGRR